jgi:hypothetical protein
MKQTVKQQKLAISSGIHLCDAQHCMTKLGHGAVPRLLEAVPAKQPPAHLQVAAVPGGALMLVGACKHQRDELRL